MNSIVVAMEKLRAAPAVCELLHVDFDGENAAIYPVMLPIWFSGNALTVNRIAEDDIEGFTCARLFITCYAASFDVCEEIGSAVVSAVTDGEMFALGDVDDIEFEKGSSDVTGYDEGRGLYLRQIEIAVKW